MSRWTRRIRIRRDASPDCFNPFSQSLFSMNSSMLFADEERSGGTSDQCVFPFNRNGRQIRNEYNIDARMEEA
jgi:hypothetical protein